MVQGPDYSHGFVDLFSLVPCCIRAGTNRGRFRLSHSLACQSAGRDRALACWDFGAEFSQGVSLLLYFARAYVFRRLEELRPRRLRDFSRAMIRSRRSSATGNFPLQLLESAKGISRSRVFTNGLLSKMTRTNCLQRMRKGQPVCPRSRSKSLLDFSSRACRGNLTLCEARNCADPDRITQEG